MKNVIKVFLPLLALFFITGCGSHSNNPTVSGTIEHAAGRKISLIGFNGGQTDTLATTVIEDNGKFSIPVEAGSLSFYALAIGQSGSIVLAFDSTQSPVIDADLENVNETYEVSNSKDSKDIRDLFVNVVPFERQLDSLMTKLQNATREKNNTDRLNYSAEYNDLLKKYKDLLLDQIDKDSTSIANYTILQRLDPKEDYAYFVKVRNGLKPRLQGNFFYAQLANNVAQMEAQKKSEAAFAPGAEAPDIVLPNPDGKEIALSTLRGKYVLIDFWASWCKPCRMENPNVVRMYKKYSKDKFEIYGVSLDQKRENWLKAIQDDKLTWLQVSDLKYWNSAAAKLYNITSIPHTVLVGPDGKIVATNLRGPSLENKLEELFGH